MLRPFLRAGGRAARTYTVAASVNQFPIGGSDLRKPTTSSP